MPTWFLIAFASPILWALVNHLDKYATTRFRQNLGIGGIMIVTNLLSAVMLPIAFLFNSQILSVAPLHILMLIGNGIMNALASICYLYAIQDDEASVVAPLFQLVPVFGYFLGFALLGETLTTQQLIGSLVILLGAAFLLFEFKPATKVLFKWKVGLLMVLASLFYASFQVLFKVVAITETFWLSAFWEYTGIVLSAVIFIVFIKSYRQNFFNVFKEKDYKFIKLMGFMEALNILGNLSTAYASLLAPIALIMIVNSYQPLFVFLFGVIITLYLPFMGKEMLRPAQVIQKLACIALMVVGTLILYNAH